MIRNSVLVAALAAAVCPAGPAPAARYGEIIPETTAVRHGLTRPWFTQIQMDRSRARVRDIVLHDGTLFVQTDRAMLHVIDAETGATLWAEQVGRPDHPSMTPGVGRDLVAIINGSRLYAVNRYNGQVLQEVEVGGAPGAGAAVSQRRAFVPMVNGLVLAYRLEPLTDPLKELGKIQKDKQKPTEEELQIREEARRQNLQIQQEYIPPLACRSVGKAMVQPLVTRDTDAEEYVVWPTDRGFLNIARINVLNESRFPIKYRLETEGDIVTRPTYLPGDPSDPADSGVIFGASRDGFVYAVEELSGEVLWRFSTGEPIVEPAVVASGRVYAPTQLGGMHCIDATTGGDLWWTPRVTKFLAASKDRVYAADKLGRILILDGNSGARLDTIEAGGLPIKLINSETDRLYLATKTGLIQCLHERELTEPFRHDESRRAAAKGERPVIRQGNVPLDGGQGPEAKPELGGQGDPFGDKGGDPFGNDGDDGGNNDAGGGNADPLGGADEDPFGSVDDGNDDPLAAFDNPFN